MAARIFSRSGFWSNLTVIRAPPLKSIPNLTPPCIRILANPATVSTSEAIMNGHFLPRKSKFVFLNNSIEPCRTGSVDKLDSGPLPFVPLPARGLDAQLRQLTATRQFVVENCLRH